jgi:hypothetical protein
MSYSALALRLATVEALCPSAALPNGPFPTDAGRLVYDSRLRPLDEAEAGASYSAIFAYTDDANIISFDPRGGPPFQAMMGLVLVLIVGAPADEEAKAEARLDALSGQILTTLFYGPSAMLWRKLTGSKVAKAEMETERSSEERAIILIRTMRLPCEVPFDCVDLNPATAPAGPDRLPEPLRAILAGLAATSYGQAIGLALRDGAPILPVLPRLEGIDMEIDAHSPPQGAADVSASIEIPQD